MAIINSYPTVTPKATDLLLVSDVDTEGNPTKTVTINSVLALVPPGSGGSGTISSIQSTNSNLLLVTDPAGPVVTLGITTSAVQSAGNSLSTSGDIYTFVSTFVADYITNGGYTSNVGTVTNVTSSSAITALSLNTTNSASTPNIALGIVGTPSNSQFLRGDGTWAVPGGTGAMSNWRITADNGTIANVVDNELVDIKGSAKIDTSASLSQEVTITHKPTATATPTGTPLSPGAGGTFDVIDAISVDSDGTGHVTSIQTTTITLPGSSSGGGVSSIGMSIDSNVSGFLTVSPSTITTSGVFTLAATGNASDYVKADGSVAAISSIPGTYTWSLGDASTQNSIGSGDTIKFVGAANSGISTSWDNSTKELTINSSNTGTVQSIGVPQTQSGFVSLLTDENNPLNPITTSGTLSAALTADGAPSAASFLRGDNHWATLRPLSPSGGLAAVTQTQVGSGGGALYFSNLAVEYEGANNVVNSAPNFSTSQVSIPQDNDTILLDVKVDGNKSNNAYEIEIQDFVKAPIIKKNNPTFFSVNVIKSGTPGTIEFPNDGNRSDNTQGFGTIGCTWNGTSKAYEFTFTNATISNTDYSIYFSFEEPIVDGNNTVPCLGYIASKSQSGFHLVLASSNPLINLPTYGGLVNIQLYNDY